MSRLVCLLATVLATAFPAAALAAGSGSPGGQFAPSVADRDGDGLPDGADCAPDDPSRPSRAGSDRDCDGVSDAGGDHADVGAPPAGGPAGQGFSAASSNPDPAGATRARARRAAGERVKAVAMDVGDSVAVYAPVRRRAGTATLIFVGRSAASVTVRATHARARTRSLPSGRAWVVRVRAPRGSRVRFRVTVTDGSGRRYRASHSARS